MRSFVALLFLVFSLFSFSVQAKMVNIKHSIPSHFEIVDAKEIIGSKLCIQVVYKKVYIGDFGEFVDGESGVKIFCED